MRQERGREAPGTPCAQRPTQALNLRASSEALGSLCLHSSPTTFLRNPPWPPSVSKQRPPSRYTGPKMGLHFSLDTHSPTSLRGDLWEGRTWLGAPPCMLTASSPCQVQGLATNGDGPPTPTPQDCSTDPQDPVWGCASPILYLLRTLRLASEM